MQNINTKKTNGSTICTDSERKLVASAMVKAGYNNITPEMVHKVPNKWGFDVYVAVVGDAMVVYTPKWDYHNDGGFNFVCFQSLKCL